MIDYEKIELKDCPFCGSKAAWFKDGSHVGVECEDETQCPGNAQTDTFAKEDAQVAADTWNTRYDNAEQTLKQLAHMLDIKPGNLYRDIPLAVRALQVKLRGS